MRSALGVGCTTSSHSCEWVIFI